MYCPDTRQWPDVERQKTDDGPAWTVKHAAEIVDVNERTVYRSAESSRLSESLVAGGFSNGPSARGSRIRSAKLPTGGRGAW